MCVCDSVSLFHNGGGYLLDLGVQKMSAITKVYLDNVRNIFLKLAEFNKFLSKILNFFKNLNIKSKELLFIFGHP